jgi:BCD family chlorophyll transporter-like MFS transporter
MSATVARGASTSLVAATFSWWQIARLGLVQAAVGAVVVLLTTTINRVIVVELGLPATIPGLLVAAHFGVQLALRPRFGHASDHLGTRSAWMIGGMAVCAVSGVAVAATLPVMQRSPVFGVALAVIASMALGAGVSAAGTPLLALMSERSEPHQRAGAAAITWILMIVGIIVTAIVSGALLDPFSFSRLTAIAAGIGASGLLLALIATRGLESPRERLAPTRTADGAEQFRDALRTVWGEPAARSFAAFILLAMLAYSAQDLILEPFAGVAFGFTPGESTSLSGTHHGGVLIGMVVTALVATRRGQLRHWAAAGCAASALTYGVLMLSPTIGSVPLFRVIVPLLGVANGVFAIGAIGSMMSLTGDRRDGRAGLRLGVFGAAQALAYAVGTLAGAAGVDVARSLLGDAVRGYLVVFGVEGVLFVFAALLAWRSASSERAGAVLAQRAELLPAVLS